MFLAEVDMAKWVVGKLYLDRTAVFIKYPLELATNDKASRLDDPSR